jgi:hypothetical protein
MKVKQTPKPSREWTRRELSTLVYVETRAVDYRGIIDHRHVNDDDIKHLDALEEHGLLVNKGTGVNRWYCLTDEGWRVAGLERRRRAELSHEDHERT